MEREKSCGAVIFRRYHGNLELLLVRHRGSGHWSFPKGHIELGESEADTARREILEETGLEVLLDTSFRHVVTYSPKRDTVKDVVYFLAQVRTSRLKPQPEEISQLKWVELSLADRFLSYDNDRVLVAKARSFLKNHSS